MSDTPPVSETVSEAVDGAVGPVLPSPIQEEGEKHSAPAQPVVEREKDLDTAVQEAVKAALEGHVATHHVAPQEHSHDNANDDDNRDESPAAKPWTHRW